MKFRGLKKAIANHVRRACRFDPARFYQEPAYVAALFARLDEVVVHRPGLRVEFRSTVVADRGHNSAESILGADFGFVASIVSSGVSIEKAVLGQAKRGSLVQLSPGAQEVFRDQVEKMSVATWATVGLEVPTGVHPVWRTVGDLGFKRHLT